MKSDTKQNAAKRRSILKGTGIVAGAAFLSQGQWAKPVLNSVMLPAHAQTSATQTIVDIAVGAAPEFSTLVNALTSTGLVPTLQGAGPFTVFAPTNAAFANIAGTVAGLTTAQLESVLLYHVLSGEQPTSAIPTTSGSPASVLQTIQASNGVIYVIDEVLLP